MFYTYEIDKKESEPLEKIQLKHLIIPFFSLGVGCFVALVVFLFEMYCGKKAQEEQQRSDSENQNMEVSLGSD